jgi:hypothetical protein
MTHKALKKKKQSNMTPSKEHNSPVTSSKEKEIYEMPGMEFKIIILRKLKEIQERQFSEVRKNLWSILLKINQEID